MGRPGLEAGPFYLFAELIIRGWGNWIAKYFLRGSGLDGGSYGWWRGFGGLTWGFGWKEAYHPAVSRMGPRLVVRLIRLK